MDKIKTLDFRYEWTLKDEYCDPRELKKDIGWCSFKCAT